ncbi:Gas vesicle synthesis protein GvpL/GvpF [Micromonospora citrea]|uniref:Gas vesicle synthesis protein GvpL/GvpF n=1 Tax=Micromonospora citrea TaxID=47855 RepID=A0A1C6V9E1_9ACTN|nr:GvpL/GvpF family gas vesicle protein [Micromonospora citrea]SCL62971.1 Gas vesicle synthesis protein GvpL/GvpF [Micromonospora citrea]
MSSTADLAPAGPTTTPGSGVWLHGVVREADAALLAATAGMDGAPVRAVRAAGLVAVVSAAPLSEYGEEALRRNLEDLAWLERAARAHHAVVAALSRAGAVVPARLATVHHDDARVAGQLVARRDELVAILDRLAGRDEWGVKGYVVPGATPRTSEPDGSGGGAGAAYLRRRRAQLTAREEGQRIAADAAAAVHGELAGHAVAARRHPPQDRRLSGAPTAMVLNGAYLVEQGTLADFRRLVDALADGHPEIRLELTGPWPPYSFAEERPAEPALTVREPAC